MTADAEMRAAINAEMLRHVDRDHIRVYHDRMCDAVGCHAQAQTRAERAGQVLAAAREALSKLRAAAAADIDFEVGRDEAAAAYTAVREAEAFVEFTAEVMRQFETKVAAAQAKLDDAKHDAHGDALRRGQDLRIAAGRKADRARMLRKAGRGGGSDAAALDAAVAEILERARREHELGRELIRSAVAGGLRFSVVPGVYEPQWPSSEEAERNYWNRPLTAEELAADAA